MSALHIANPLPSRADENIELTAHELATEIRRLKGELPYAHDGAEIVRCLQRDVLSLLETVAEHAGGATKAKFAAVRDVALRELL